MNPSELRERITFERLEGERWLAVEGLEVWAALEPKGNETYLVRIRYRSDLCSLLNAQPGLRVLWGDHVLEVTSVVEFKWHEEVHLLVNHTLIPMPSLRAGIIRKRPWPS